MVTTIDIPTRIVFGVGAVGQLGKEAKQLGKKAIIVTYPDIRKVGLLDRVLADLMANGVVAIVFDKVEPNPRSSTIDQGAELARQEQIDLVIGLGGGSAMDTAKGIAIASTGKDSVWVYVLQGLGRPKGPVPPLITVPTMAGTGSEINQISVVTHWDTHEKRAWVSPTVQAKVALIDPEITTTVPLNQTKAGAVDSFCHVVEVYVTDGTPTIITDGIREATMKAVVKYLPIAIANPNDLEARTNLSWASTLSMSHLMSLGSGNGAMTLHGIEHALSGYYDVTHGAGLAAMLPAWMKVTQPVRKERFEALGKNVFGKKDGIKATEEWLTSVGMNLRLRDLGCDLEKADIIANLAVKSSPWIVNHPTPLDASNIAKIYREAY